MLSLLVALAAPAHAETVTVHCYRDADGDGYAPDGAAMIDIEVTDDGGISEQGETGICASLGAYAPLEGDCDDADPDRHPYRSEIYDNEDNDCDELFNEPTFGWPYVTSSAYHGDTSLVVRTRFNDFWTQALAANSSNYVRAKVHYRAAADATWKTVNKRVTLSSSSPWASITLVGLEEGTVYEVEVESTQYWNGSAWVTLGTWISNPRNHYFAMTTGGGYDLEAERHQVVTRALYELGAYGVTGRIGYEGSSYPDGTRYLYTGADPDDNWCTEFYAYALRSGVADPGADTIPEMASWFSRTHVLDESGDHALSAEPGDWLWLDTKDTKRGGHSVMVLDVGATHVATIGGNETNRIGLRQRSLTSDQVVNGGLGHLVR